jgi:16S rRNA (uracil1498-N3)-methyltransferase
LVLSLSNIELYYALPENTAEGAVKIVDEECYHIVKVMRHSAGDELYVTNGKGNIFRTEITHAEKEFVTAHILETYTYADKNENKIFCIPRLKSPERFEFALEKSVELGITNFIVFESKRTIAKGAKLERWNKILLSAMKQSLRSFLPNVSFAKSVKDILMMEGEKIVFEQNSKNNLADFVFRPDKKYYFIFGPEGGLDESELSLFTEDNFFEINEHRLRSETAVIKAASIAG